MRPEALIQSLGEQLTTTGGAHAAFGEPVTQGDRTVIPVARVASFFGGGAGGLAAAAEERSPERGGGGGGGATAEVADLPRSCSLVAGWRTSSPEGSQGRTGHAGR